MIEGIITKGVGGNYYVDIGNKIIECRARGLFRLKNIKTKINPVSSDLFPRPAKRPKYSVLANTKLPALRTWKDALEEYLKKYN